MSTSLQHMKCSERNKTVAIILFVLFVVWQLPGIFPAISFEADALSICSGCEYSYRHGWETLGDRGYGYWMQPFTYILILGIKSIMPGVGCETIYSVISSVAAILFQILSVVLVKSISRINPVFLVLSLFLLPESYALAMYPNSTSLCAIFFTGAMCLIIRGRLMPAAIMLVIAPLFRLDVLIIYPVLPLMLHLGGMPLRRSFIISAVFGCVVAITTAVIYILLDADFIFATHEYSRYNKTVAFKRNVMAVFGFYGIVSTLLLSAGLFILYRKREYVALTLIVTALAVTHLILFKFGNASKHFALLIPFVIYATATALGNIFKIKQRVSRYTILVSICAIYILGIQFKDSVNAPAQTTLNRDVPVLAGIDFSIGDRELEAVIGGGQAAMTADEPVLTSGNLFYPMFIHNLKMRDIASTHLLAEAIGREPDANYIYSFWEEESRLDLLIEEEKIPRIRMYKDPAIESYLQNVENQNGRHKLYDYIRDTYCTTPSDSKAYFIRGEAISSRWNRMTSILEDSGMIQPDPTHSLFIISVK